MNALTATTEFYSVVTSSMSFDLYGVSPWFDVFFSLRPSLVAAAPSAAVAAADGDVCNVQTKACVVDDYHLKNQLMCKWKKNGRFSYLESQ